jgi:hypothetical protein
MSASHTTTLHLRTNGKRTVHSQLQLLLDSLSRSQWLALRRDLGITIVSRSKYVASLRDDEVAVINTGTRMAAWMHTNGFQEDAAVKSAAVTESALENLFATHPHNRDTILNLLNSKAATMFRACSTTCRALVSAFDWPLLNVRAGIWASGELAFPMRLLHTWKQVMTLKVRLTA